MPLVGVINRLVESPLQWVYNQLYLVLTQGHSSLHERIVLLQLELPFLSSFWSVTHLHEN